MTSHGRHGVLDNRQFYIYCQQLIKANNTENMHYWHFVSGIYWWLVDIPRRARAITWSNVDRYHTSRPGLVSGSSDDSVVIHVFVYRTHTEISVRLVTCYAYLWFDSDQFYWYYLLWARYEFHDIMLDKLCSDITKKPLFISLTSNLWLKHTGNGREI